MPKLRNPNAYAGEQWSWVGKNSLAITSGDFVTKAVGVVDKAIAWEDIYGLSKEKTTYSSDNQTVAKARCEYNLLWSKDKIELPVSGQTITFSGALVTSNAINLSVNGTAMTEVDFDTSDATTLAAIATQLTTDFPTLIASASAWTNSVLLTPVTNNNSVAITGIVVTAWAWQATWTVANDTIAFTDEEKYADIATGGQALDYHTLHASSGQVRIREEREDGAVAVVTVANT